MRPTEPNRPARRPRRAMTLVELVLGMSVLALVGLAVLSLATATTNAAAHSRERTDTIQASQIGMHRLEGLFRRAKLVPSADATRVVVWASDATDVGRINVSEVLVLEYAAGAGTLTQHRAKVGAQDPAVELSQLLNPAAVLPWLSSGRQVETAVLLDGLTSCTIQPDAAPPLTGGVNIRFDRGQGETALRLACGARLRASAAAYVEREGEQWHLRDVPVAVAEAEEPEEPSGGGTLLDWLIWTW